MDVEGQASGHPNVTILNRRAGHVAQLALAQCAYVTENGKVAFEGAGSVSFNVRESYLGASS
jgi:hypothetical protein